MPDREVVALQLQRKDIQPFQVKVRCPAGYPAVIQTEPHSSSDSARVFTTMYWLTCPALIRHLSRFESEGWVPRLEETIRTSEPVRESMNRLHQEYAGARREAVGHTKLSMLRRTAPKTAASLEATGIGGVADFAHVKCLHAHAAFDLVRGGHPLFDAHPDLRMDLSGCTFCDRLT